MASGKGVDCGWIRKEMERAGGDGAGSSREGAKIRRVLEYEKKQDRHQQQSMVERRWRILGVGARGRLGRPDG